MIFTSVSPASPDAILGLTEAFKNDANPKKINLGVGVFKDENGKTPVLASVREAERRILEGESSKSYMPIPGLPEYGRFVRELLFGGDDQRVSDGSAQTAQTPGGTGALCVGANLLKLLRPEAKIWMSRPTWANHKGVFSKSGFEIEEYFYYDAQTKGLDFEAMKQSLQNVPENDVVLLHVCCHNPTGVDLMAEQWKEVGAIAAEKGWIPFFDFAYQGFGTGIEEDRAGMSAVLDQCNEALIASSFSKNFGLYQERTGALTVVAADSTQCASIFSHLKKIIRVIYSNPPAHGGKIVTTILGDPELKAQWLKELDAMRDRIKQMRSQIVDTLKEKGSTVDFEFIKHQNGMFSFSGLNDEQVAFLKDEKSIYIVKGGRINVAGITPANMAYLCDSVIEALEK